MVSLWRKAGGFGPAISGMLFLLLCVSPAGAQFHMDLGPIHIHTDGDGGAKVDVTRFIGVDTTEGSEVHVGPLHVGDAEDGPTLWQEVTQDVTNYLAEEAAKPEKDSLETVATGFEKSEAKSLTEAFWLLNISLRAKNDAGVANGVQAVKKWDDAGQGPTAAELTEIYAYAMSECAYPKLARLLCENFPDRCLASATGMPSGMLETVKRTEGFTDEQMTAWIYSRLDGALQSAKETLELANIAAALTESAASTSPDKVSVMGMVEVTPGAPPQPKNPYVLAAEFYRKALEIPLTEHEISWLNRAFVVARTPERIQFNYHDNTLVRMAECYRNAGDAETAQKVTQELNDYRSKNGI